MKMNENELILELIRINLDLKEEILEKEKILDEYSNTLYGLKKDDLEVN